MSDFPLALSSSNCVQASGAPDLFIGIPTFNRKEIVKLTARSLSLGHDLASAQILVLDDASADYSVEFLREIYPAGARILRNEAPSGTASQMARRLMESFLSEKASTLIILDSDLLVAADFLAKARSNLPLADGLLSLFNAHSHPGTEKGDLLLKKTIGFAGSVWTRALVQEVLDNVKFTIHFDDEICAYMQRINRGIYSLKHSAVQHIGLLAGENSRFMSSDFGLSFTDTSWYNLSATQEIFLEGCRQELRRMDRQHLSSMAKLRERLERLEEAVQVIKAESRLYQRDASENGSLILSFKRRWAAATAAISSAFKSTIGYPNAHTPKRVMNELTSDE